MEAEDLGPAAPATKRAVGVARAEGVRRVVNDGPATRRREGFERRRIARTAPQVRGDDRSRLVCCRSRKRRGRREVRRLVHVHEHRFEARVSHRVRRRDECERGQQHLGAGARSSARSASSSPIVPLATATTCATPKYSAAALSNRTTNGPWFVSSRVERISLISFRKPSTSSTFGRPTTSGSSGGAGGGSPVLRGHGSADGCHHAQPDFVRGAGAAFYGALAPPYQDLHAPRSARGRNTPP